MTQQPRTSVPVTLGFAGPLVGSATLTTDDDGTVHASITVPESTELGRIVSAALRQGTVRQLSLGVSVMQLAHPTQTHDMGDAEPAQPT